MCLHLALTGDVSLRLADNILHVGVHIALIARHGVVALRGTVTCGGSACLVGLRGRKSGRDDTQRLPGSADAALRGLSGLRQGRHVAADAALRHVEGLHLRLRETCNLIVRQVHGLFGQRLSTGQNALLTVHKRLGFCRYFLNNGRGLWSTLCHYAISPLSKRRMSSYIRLTPRSRLPFPAPLTAAAVMTNSPSDRAAFWTGWPS